MFSTLVICKFYGLPLDALNFIIVTALEWRTYWTMLVQYAADIARIQNLSYRTLKL